MEESSEEPWRASCATVNGALNAAPCWLFRGVVPIESIQIVTRQKIVGDMSCEDTKADMYSGRRCHDNSSTLFIALTMLAVRYGGNGNK